MQCEIRGMGEMAEAGQANTDTLPKPGRVNEVCREWLVKEDGALAYQLQTEEIKHHYTGNKSRNALVRQDFPHALDEQRREEKEAASLRAMYHQMVHQQEQVDAQVAKQLAEKMEREELERRQALEEGDQEIARKLQQVVLRQERERLRIERFERERLSMQASTDGSIEHPQYDRDMNNVGLPSPSQYSPDSLSQQFRLCTLTDAAVQTNSICQSPEEVLLVNPPSPAGLSEEEARRIQEEQDAEFARLLQEQEGSRQLDMLDQDRLIAIEAQDKELARLLQERERAKAKRARERAKQKALLKKQQQLLSDDEGFVASPSVHGCLLPSSQWSEQDGLITAHSTAVRPTDLDLTSGASRSASRGRQRFPDPEAIDVLPSPEPGPSHSALPNIAMAIDPTYPRRATITHTSTYNTSVVDPPPSNISSPAVSLPPPEFDDEDDDSPVPPYMPIQGQRRSASLEKKNKKGRSKDSCKQQ
ncbi:coiled-coil domain-containing protein 50 isoform X2 [Zootermopsis nevadensis]|uniref:coiled-coil domain-containing protein 50 isoform X2 n=1 Tax=Zootermopsis nevadensis TaxID=136037 RepID=UPI000B8EC402|nr:coiled-coil domain-containing protein 50 isoform X2 [Zootermopsis nevadensis]